MKTKPNPIVQQKELYQLRQGFSNKFLKQKNHKTVNIFESINKKPENKEKPCFYYKSTNEMQSVQQFMSILLNYLSKVKSNKDDLSSKIELLSKLNVELSPRLNDYYKRNKIIRENNAIYFSPKFRSKPVDFSINTKSTPLLTLKQVDKQLTVTSNAFSRPLSCSNKDLLLKSPLFCKPKSIDHAFEYYLNSPRFKKIQSPRLKNSLSPKSLKSNSSKKTNFKSKTYGVPLRESVEKKHSTFKRSFDNKFLAQRARKISKNLRIRSSCEYSDFYL